MPFIHFARGGARIAAAYRRLPGVEGEIAFLLGEDLPPRSVPYTREEVAAAIASCHPGIELLKSALFRRPADDDRRPAVQWRIVPGDPVSGMAILSAAQTLMLAAAR